MTWDHQVLSRASTMNLLSYTKDSKLIEKVLTEFFDKNPKIVRQSMLSSVDVYTQKQRNLAKDIIKKNLRYNARKGKYYNITKKLPNNSFNFD
jgi:predicted nuclease of predicted toxin-antitoxin system